MRPTQNQTTETKADRWSKICDLALKSGFPPEIVYAMRRCGTIITIENHSRHHPIIVELWKESIDEYVRDHRDKASR